MVRAKGEKCFDWTYFWKAFLSFIGTLTLSTTAMVIMIGIYALLDFTQRPKFLMKYKIQTDKNVPLDAKNFLKVCFEVFAALTHEDIHSKPSMES